MELLFHDPLAKLSFLLTQMFREDDEGPLDLRDLIRVAMAEGAIATRPL